MIDVEHEPTQLIVGTALMLSTVVIQTFGAVTLEELVLFWRDRVVEKTTRPRMLAILGGVIQGERGSSREDPKRLVSPAGDWQDPTVMCYGARGSVDWPRGKRRF